MRAVYPLLLLAIASAPALAQDTSQNTPQPNAAERGQLSTQEQKADQRPEPRVERIVVEDAGSRVDEVRAGGETKSITVQPKANVPPYSVQPADPTNMSHGEAGPGAPGRRVWKVEF